MWQQAALPHPPLPVSHGCPDDTCWQGWEMAAKETPKWTLPPHSQHTLTLTHTHTHTHPQLQGFAINTNAGEGNGEGGGQGVQWWGGKGRRQCCRNAEIRDRIQKKI